MIDTHAHILPAVDDGVQNMEDALDMLRKLKESGVEAVCLTPHYALLRGFHEDKGFYRERFDLLQSRTKAEEIGIDLYLGSEIDEYDGLENLIEKAHTLNGTRFVLIDFGMRKAQIDEIVYTLKVKGYETVVAHPERYRYMTLKDWRQVKREGGLLQVSASHLIKEGSKTSQKMAGDLLKAGLVDLVASDIHSIRHAHVMKKAYVHVKKKLDKKTADRLFIETPKKVLGLE